MQDIKRGQKVWLSIEGEIIETTAKSVGPKYVTVEYNSEILFDRRTLKRRGSSSCFIIIDIEKHKKEQYIKGLIDEIKNFKWETVDKEDLEKFVDILRNTKS